MGLVIHLRIGDILFNPVRIIRKILLAGNRSIKGNIGRKVAGVIVILSDQLVETQVLVIVNKAFDSPIRDQRTLRRDIHNGKTIRGKITSILRREFYLGPVTDQADNLKFRL